MIKKLFFRLFIKDNDTNNGIVEWKVRLRVLYETDTLIQILLFLVTNGFG